MAVRDRAEPFVGLFLHLNIWLCLLSLFAAVITAIALGIPASGVGVGLLLPPLLFYFIYVEDRRPISPEDRVNHPQRTALVERYQTGLLVSEAVALLGYEAVLLSAVLTRPDVGVGTAVLGQLPLLVLAVYGSMKRYPAFDSLMVGATWAFVLLFAVLVTGADVATTDAKLVFLAWFLIAFAGVESRNVADIEGDRRADQPTLASALGARATRRLEALLKLTGIAVFWLVAGPLSGLLVATYLGLLRGFRLLTSRRKAHAEN
jgi:4-hydroxybenzoate polyprenyltransferase